MGIFDFLKKNKNQEVKETIENGIKLDELQQEESFTEEPEVVQDVATEVAQEQEVAQEELLQEEIQEDTEQINQEIPEEMETHLEEIKPEETAIKKKNFFEKIISGLDKTRKNILSGVDNVLKNFVSIDEELFEELEESLIMSDIGVETSVKVISLVKDRVKKERISEPSAIKQIIAEEITKILVEGSTEFELPSPSVILIIGVNGVGKTTTIGKLSSIYQRQGKKVVVAAADTFRAAAIDQLEVWCKRADVDLIKHQEGSDPAAVVYDAVQASKARKADLLIVDTAGRLHNKKNLMNELSKIFRIISREYENVHKEVFLVLDATTGQNAMQQAKIFKESADITGIVLTKLDGTAKGGIIISIKNELNVPVRFIGIGEAIDDLRSFDAEEFSKALFTE